MMFEEYKDKDLERKLYAIVSYYERMLIDRKTGTALPGVEDKKEYFIFSTCREAMMYVWANENKDTKTLITIADAMAAFDDFMRGDVCPEETEAFYNMLLEKIVWR